MRVSMSAIGSVSICSLLPARLGHARDRALMRQRAQADPAEAELLEDCARATALVAARIGTHLVARRTLLLDDERLLCHLAGCLLIRFGADERQPEAAQQRERLLVRLRGGGDGDVEAADGPDGVVVDLREDDLLADAERVVAATVEGAHVQAAEVADTRERDRDEPVEELVHAGAAQRHLRADGHALAELEGGDRLAGATHLRALTCDRGQLLDRGVERLRVGLGVADAHVQGDLRDPRHLHDRVEAELLLELGAQRLVAVFQAGAVGRGRHHLVSTSWPQPSRLQTRTRTVSPLISLIFVPTRVGSLQTGQTSITFEMSTGAAFSIRPPGAICTPPIRLESRSGLGRVWRVITFRFSTSTRPSRGRASRIRPCLPRSFPARICTRSPFLIFIFVDIFSKAPLGPG